MRKTTDSTFRDHSLSGSGRAKLRTPAAAEYIGASASFLNKRRVYGGGPPFMKLPGGMIVYDLDDLDRWLDSCRCDSTSSCAA